MRVAETTGDVNAAPWVTAHREGVSFALELATTDAAGDPTRHLLQAGQLADELGFDALFLPDHPTFMPDCWLHLAALAATTKRIWLGTGVACSLYRHPVVLARLAADLDRMSGGRLVLGLGVGWSASEFARLGLALPPTRVRQIALEETIAILHGVWGGQPFTYQGSYFATAQARIDPPPVQQPRPPLLVAGGGERVTLRQVAQYADACQLGDFGMLNGARSPDGIRDKLAVLSQHCTAVGRAYDAILRTHFTGWLILAEDPSRLKDKVERYAPQGLENRYSGAWAGYAVAATPEQAVEYYQARVDAGIQYFVVQTMDASDTETIRLLAEKVVPRITRSGGGRLAGH